MTPSPRANWEGDLATAGRACQARVATAVPTLMSGHDLDSSWPRASVHATYFL